MTRQPFSQPPPFTKSHLAVRLLWNIVCALLYRTSPIPFHAWRRMLLRVFGASVATDARPYPRARIWAPWNLRMEAASVLANDVDCYSVARITLGRHATVSQYSYLCSASHDYMQPSMPMICAPISIEDDAWVAADAFVGPGVTVGRGAVVCARSTVIRDVPAWHVVAGSPVRNIRLRPEFERP